MKTTTWLGKYQIVTPLGQGGMGEVFLAVLRGPSGFNRLVVVKSLRHFGDDREKYRAMLLDEARLAARLRHPNVVQTFEVGEVDDRPLIAMEYLDGQPLNAIVARARALGRPLGVALAAYIMREALAGLHYAHELEDYDGTKLHVVHRDVTPHNIFVTYEGEVKVVDFGIAKAKTNQASTAAGNVKGKLAYLAPEQARGEPLDRRVDVFAAGLVLWELLTSRRLFEGEVTPGVVRKLLDNPVPTIVGLCPGASAELDDVVLRALAKDRDERFATAEQMQNALQPFARGVDRTALGRRVRDMFESERAEIRARIRGAMQPMGFDDRSTTASSPDVAPAPAERPSKSPAAMPIAATSIPAPAPEPRRREVKRRPWPVLTGTALLALCAIGSSALVRGRFQHAQPAPPPPAPVTVSAAVAPAAPSAEVILRIQGSRTMGEELVPALVEAFMRRKGASITVARDDDKTTRVIAAMPGKPVPEVTLISTLGDDSAFAWLADGRADIGMSSRAMTREEAALLAKAGDGEMSDGTSEHVIGLDAVSVIVHPKGKVRRMTIAEVAGIFHGDSTNWPAIDGRRASTHPIAVYAENDESPSFHFLEHALGDRNVVANAKRFTDEDELSDAVSSEPDAIGFVSLSHVRSAKPVAVESAGGIPMVVTPLTIATESYPLSHRLYFYTGRSANPVARDLVAFASTPEGQEIVRAAGYIDLNVTASEWYPCTARCPSGYASIVKHARRLSLDFHFQPGTSELDDRSADLERVARYVQQHDGRIALLGFSDASASSTDSLKDSRACARKIAALLEQKGVRVAATEGFGDAMPILAKDNPEASYRNRRVEVWVTSERTAEMRSRRVASTASDVVQR